MNDQTWWILQYLILTFRALSAFILIGIIIGTCMEVWFIIQAKKGNENKPTSNQICIIEVYELLYLQSKKNLALPH